MSADEPAKATFDAAISEQIVQGSKTHWNVSQDVIVTTEDRIRLCILGHLTTLAEKGGWVAPVSLFFTFATAMTTADFRNFVLPAATWHAVFAICTLLTGLWSVYAIIRAYRVKGDIDTLVQAIKRTAKQNVETQALAQPPAAN
jgi:hypothetical protein